MLSTEGSLEKGTAMLEVNGVLVYSEDTAHDALASLGMDKIDAENFARLLCENELDEAEYQRDVARQEFEAMEARLDEIQSCMNEVINLIDEALDMERISKPRERFEALKRIIESEY